MHFALDLCLGTGAFVVTPAGDVHTVLSDEMPPDDGHRRMEALARSCLAHPGAHGREIFWNSELTTGPLANDFSLACVVTPVWAGNTRVGLLGVADNWLPEPDSEQQAGLAGLAESLSQLLPCPTTPAFIGTAPGDPAAGSRLWGAPSETNPLWGDPPDPGHPPDPGQAPDPGHAPEGSPLESRPPWGRRSEDPQDHPPGGSAGPGDGSTYEEDLAPFFERLLDQLPDALLVTTGGGQIVLVNRRLLAMTELSAGDLLGKDVSDFLLPGSSAGSAELRGTAPHQLLDGRYHLAGRGGAGRQEVDVRSAPVTTPFAGDCIVTSIRPVGSTEHRGASTAVTDLIESLDDGIMFLGATGEVVWANRTANILHGLPPGRSLIGSTLPEATALRTEDGHVVAHDQHPGLKVLSDGLPVSTRVTFGDGKEGQRYITMSARPATVAGQVGALVVMHDTTETWLEQQRLTHYALHDPLTNLANRYLLLEEIRRMLQGLARRGGSVALVFIDLDNFKRINDEHGHDVGDEALSAVARRLLGTVRAEDVVARLGGDEFVIAHMSADPVPDGDLVVSRVRKVLSAPFRLRGQAFDLGASIGWVSTDTSEVGPDELLSRADRAMYRHKRDRSGIRSRVG